MVNYIIHRDVIYLDENSYECGFKNTYNTTQTIVITDKYIICDNDNNNLTYNKNDLLKMNIIDFIIVEDILEFYINILLTKFKDE